MGVSKKLQDFVSAAKLRVGEAKVNSRGRYWVRSCGLNSIDNGRLIAFWALVCTFRHVIRFQFVSRSLVR